MIKSIDKRKNKIIADIKKIKDEASLLKLEQQLQRIQEHVSIYSKVLTPIKKTITVGEMIKEQNYKPLKREEFFKLAETLEIEESIEELLGQLD